MLAFHSVHGHNRVQRSVTMHTIFDSRFADDAMASDEFICHAFHPCAINVCEIFSNFITKRGRIFLLSVHTSMNDVVAR